MPDKEPLPLEDQFVAFPMPAFLDLPNLTEAEMKVLLYVQRHTRNYGTGRRILSTDELANGRKRKDGTRMDNGTGLSNRAIIDALRSLEQRRYLFTADEEGGQKSYALIDCQPLTKLVKIVHRPKPRQGRVPMKKVHKGYEESSQVLMNKDHNPSEQSSQAVPSQTTSEAAPANPTDTLDKAVTNTQIDTLGVLAERENEYMNTEEEPDLPTLRVQYTEAQHLLSEIDAQKHPGAWERAFRAWKVVEQRLHARLAQEAARQRSEELAPTAELPPIAEIEQAIGEVKGEIAGYEQELAEIATRKEERLEKAEQITLRIRERTLTRDKLSLLSEHLKALEALLEAARQAG